jgi:translation initiation factor 2 subunit 1
MAKEFPEEDEVLLGTVDKLLGTSVFVKIERYNKEGVISFSEVAPGRIRNIRDYVYPGKKILCKALRVDERTGHIDLSLRRVTSKEKKDLAETLAREKEATVMLGLVIKDKNRLDSIVDAIKEKLGLAQFLETSASDMNTLVNFGLSKDEANSFIALVAEKAKQKMVSIKAEIRLSSEAEDGIERIKNVLSVDADIKYLSAPRYLITLKDKDYKEANKRLKEVTDAIAMKAKQLNCNFEQIEK